jgi:hypothetical protein
MPTIVKRRKPKPDPKPIAEVVRPKRAPRLVYMRSVENRRVMALELAAYAFDLAEACETPDELQAFAEQLEEVRTRTWGARPWSNASKDPDRAREHLIDMFNGFVAEVGAPGYSGEDRRYKNRAHAPAAPGAS